MTAPHVGDAEEPVLTSIVRAELLISIFATGAAVILIEILGTRVIGPVFGVSLFVWSALLAVTLGSLAVGYYVGGVLADRAPTVRLLGLAITGAGLLLSVVPLLSDSVLRVADGMGPRAGSVFAASLLFAPCLMALGTTGPIAVRLATVDVRASGHKVGVVYAVSTAGSLVGSLLTGFVIVPAFETDQILFGAAIALILIGASSLATHWRRGALIAAVVPVLASTADFHSPLPAGIVLVDHAHSLYGLVEVVDDNNRQVRFLRADHSLLGAQFFLDHSSGFAFVYLLEALRFARPSAKNTLQIGLGTGALPSLLEPLGIKVDVVEIDPVVVRFARRYFGFKPLGKVYEEDARTFLRRTTDRYDLVVHDTFTGGTTPEHLLSLEVFRRIHSLLRPGGVLALNFVGYHSGSKAAATWAVARTLRAVFPAVRAFADMAQTDASDEAGNLIFFASDTAISFDVPDDVRFENGVRDHVLHSFQDWELAPPIQDDGLLITDAHNPLARLQLPIAEEHFEAMNKLLPIDVWLH